MPSGTDQSSRAKPIRGGIAGYAGVLDFRGDAFGRKGCLQAGHKTLVVGQPITSRQRIAEGDDFDRRLGVHRCRAKQRHATNRRTGDLDAARAATHMIGHESMKGAGQPAT